MMSSDKIIVGRVGAPFGVKGWVKINSFTKPESNITSYHPWMLQVTGDWQVVEIAEQQMQSKGLVVRFSHITDRDQAAALTHTDIAVPRSELPALDDDEYYWYQLEGLNVIDLNDKPLGTVEQFLETGAHDVMMVARQGGSFGVPFVMGNFIKEVNLDAGYIRVDWDPDDYL